jgi:hypothetical protein
MRKFLLTITLVLLGYNSFAELVFRDDFQDANSIAPWSINFSNGASAGLSENYASEYLLIFYVNNSSTTNSINVSREFIVNPDSSYELSLAAAVFDGDIAFNAPIRIYGNGNEYFH